MDVSHFNDAAFRAALLVKMAEDSSPEPSSSSQSMREVDNSLAEPSSSQSVLEVDELSEDYECIDPDARRSDRGWDEEDDSGLDDVPLLWMCRAPRQRSQPLDEIRCAFYFLWECCH